MHVDFLSVKMHNFLTKHISKPFIKKNIHFLSDIQALLYAYPLNN